MKNKMKILIFIIAFVLIAIVAYLVCYQDDARNAINYALETNGKVKLVSIKEFSNNQVSFVLDIVETSDFLLEFMSIAEKINEFLIANPNNELNNCYKIALISSATNGHLPAFSLSNFCPEKDDVLHMTFDTLDITFPDYLFFSDENKDALSGITHICLWNNSSEILLPQIEECFDSLDYLFCQASDEVCEEFRLKFPDCIVENK